jgi:hypothetical protein
MATLIVGLVLSVAVVDGSQQAAGGQVSHTYGTAGTSGETLTVDDGGGGVAGWPSARSRSRRTHGNSV